MPEDNVEVVDNVTGPPAEAQNTDNTAEHMIPKSRFDEVNKRLREMEKQAQAAAKQAEEQAQAQAAEQGKYKELWESEQKRASELAEKLTLAELTRVRQSIAHKYSLPPVLVERLRGATEEEIEADAKTLLEAMPKPVVPSSTDGRAGVNGSMPTPRKSDVEIREMANRLGVQFEHLKKQFAE